MGPAQMQPFSYQDTSVDSLPTNELDNYGSIPVISPEKCISSDSYSNPLNSINPWVYSSSGIDLIGILSKVINRPCPAIQIGPVDLSCAFLVVDARKFDFPIVYASESFEKLTGYSNREIVGRNCRFLQSPDGHVSLGSRRRYTDNTVVHQIKNSMVNSKESQVSIINYKKNGQPFINLITIIPVTLGDSITYYVGFQVVGYSGCFTLTSLGYGRSAQCNHGEDEEYCCTYFPWLISLSRWDLRRELQQPYSSFLLISRYYRANPRD